MNTCNKNTLLSKQRINALRTNFKKYGSSNKSKVISVTAKELGCSTAVIGQTFYKLSKQGVKFFQLTEEDGSKYPINTKNVLQSKNTSEDKDSFLKLVLSKLSKEDLAEIILASHK